jgi:metal-dependent amidase/aminoacylase/carboxypeptidase family protein
MQALAESLLGREHMYFTPEPSLGADDFAFFTRYCDGIYMNVGTNSGKEAHPQNIHSEYFSPDEEAMKNAMLMEVMGVLKLLEKPKEQ